MQVHCDEGVANYIGPEPCADIREEVGEASVGERAGQPPVISILAGRMLRVPDQTGSSGLIVIAPFESADFRLPPRRGDGEIHDSLHGNCGAPITVPEMLTQPCKFVGGRPPRAFPGLANQTQLAAGGARLLDDLGTHRKRPGRSWRPSEQRLSRSGR